MMKPFAQRVSLLEKLTQTARILANSITPVILFVKGITAQRDECLVEELYKFAVLVGAVDSERAGFLLGQGRDQQSHGCLAGLDKVFELNGQKAVFAAIGDSRISKSLERLSKAPYLVVQASYESHITELGNVVLPVTVWSEQEGTSSTWMDGFKKPRRCLLLPKLCATT